MTPPSQIAHYRITAKLGEGGMGAVYRATDTRLNREVAIKVLPEVYAQDPDRMARFTREAQVLAGLNHPNIAAIYGVEERALVMELAPGDTLAERIAQGAIPLDEALPLARQIAEALEYAHEKGIIHRDLKPANIKVTPEGKVKVLDFGLAKALSNDSALADPASSPTLTMRATMAGVIMGTAGYMAPEQAKGKPVDRRADIWAFGVVVVEMLTGRLMYTGETVSETLASVIKDKPNLDSLPAETPRHIRRMLQRCLEKDPQRRLQAIGEARIAIDEPAEAPAPVAAAAAPQRRVPLPWLAAGLAAGIALTWAGVKLLAPVPTEQPLLRLSVDMGPDAIAGTRRTAAISPDGSSIVYPVRTAGQTRLALRRLDESKAMILVGSDGGADPFFSPDGEWIGFIARGMLKKISVQGGAPIELCEISGIRGATWSDDGNIYASLDGTHIFRVPGGGGKPELLTRHEQRGEGSHRAPESLPGGEAILFTALPTAGSSAGNYDSASIETLSLKTGQIKTIVRGGFSARYLAGGFLVYLNQNKLFGVRFDARRLETRGTPVRLLEDVAATALSALGPAEQFDFSRTGTLVYLSGGSEGPPKPLVWLDASSTRPLLPAPQARVVTPRVSPDGKLLAAAVGGDIWVFDPERGASTRLTSETEAQYPVWTPNGKAIVFMRGLKGIGWVRADGSAPPRTLLESPAFNIVPQSFTRDGRKLAYHTGRKSTNDRDIFVIPVEDIETDRATAGTPETFLATDVSEADPVFSPDGRWLAYIAGSLGTYQVFVRPYPEGAQGGGQAQVSTVPGRFPMWSPVSQEIYYVDNDGHIQAVPYTTSGRTFLPGKPRQWSPLAIELNGVAYPIDIAPNGKSFAAALASEGGGKTDLHLNFLINFFDEVRRRVR